MNFVEKNGLEFYCLGDYETGMAYDSIFVNKIYEHPTLIVNDGDTIVDIGANIGLYPLYLYREKKLKDLNIYAFEPFALPRECLEKNLKRYFSKYKISEEGVSNFKGEKEFTFYPNFSIGSAASCYSDWGSKMFGDSFEYSFAKERNISLNDKWKKQIKKLSNVYLAKETIKCKVNNLSNIISENNISKIDMLKINAENSEWDIMSSLGDGDWSIIRQMMIEVHDEDDVMLRKITDLLSKRNFSYDVKEDPLQFDSNLKIYLVYAISNSKQG